jgi:hypothetical protein
MPGKPANATEKEYELYLEERRVLVAAQRETAASFDKAILTLASGAFGVSIVFLKDIVPKPLPNTLSLLGWSWMFFAASLATILIGFLSSQSACTRQIDVCEGELLRNEKAKNRWATVTYVCNWASILMVLMAFGFSGAFVYFNYLRR